MQIFQTILLELPMFTVHFSFSSELGTRHPIGRKMQTAPKTKVKIKICAHSRE